MDAMQQYCCVLDSLKSKTRSHFMFSFRATLPSSSSHVHFLRIISVCLASLKFCCFFFFVLSFSCFGSVWLCSYLITKSSMDGTYLNTVHSKRIYANLWYVSSTLSLPMVHNPVIHIIFLCSKSYNNRNIYLWIYSAQNIAWMTITNKVTTTHHLHTQLSHAPCPMPHTPHFIPILNPWQMTERSR